MRAFQIWTGPDHRLRNNYRTHDINISININVAYSSNILEQQERKLSIMQTNQKKHEDEDNANVNAMILEDNPCWGSPTRHRLQDLLSLIDCDSSIVYESAKYLVLNKPPDLRMDGPYPASVFKLLTYWFPPPSLDQCKPKSTSISTGPAMATLALAENGAKTEKARYNNDDKYNLPLLEVISSLHKHNDVSDNFLRPCHQLDYATSGVLLVAKTQDAAAHVGRLFEERHEGVQKSYVAIVVGDLLLTNNSSCCNEKEISGKSGIAKVPIWTGGNTTRQLRKRMQLLEGSYRRTRAAAGKQHRRTRDESSKSREKKNEEKSSFANGTFQGFQPAHSMFLKWKSKLKKELSKMKNRSAGTINDTHNVRDKSSSPQKKRQKKNSNSCRALLLTDEDWKRIWDPVTIVIGSTATMSPKEQETDFQNINWKQLKKEHPTLAQAMIRSTDMHNEILREAVRNEEQKELVENDEDLTNGRDGEKLPSLFRLSKDFENMEIHEHENHESNNANTDENSFYICCPLAQHPDRFNMVVPSDIAKEYPHLPIAECTDSGKGGDSIDLKFRPSLTKCTILERGTLPIRRDNAETAKTINVTKVRLFPITGRRHQLRVHMALAGFPILGDVTYGGKDRVAGSKKDDENKDGKEQDTRRDVCSRMCLHAQSLELPTLLGEKTPGWKVVTPDPFVFRADGKLQLHQNN